MSKIKWPTRTSFTNATDSFPRIGKQQETLDTFLANDEIIGLNFRESIEKSYRSND